ncbi:MAG: hypothetical protein FWE35_14275 [Streptosporangiales bacterium]|jgi:hypothetical protein|nr:hypothetical protein [Streptosporangiales bacterium]
MKTGNNLPAANHRHMIRARVRDDSQRQLRDIEELVAKLQLVTKQLQHPVRSAAEHIPHRYEVS